ncbi:hypothetical protein SLE2022_161180 [Rubroshorea leprosula]
MYRTAASGLWVLEDHPSGGIPASFANVSLPPTLPDYIEPGKTKISALPNVVKMVSETSVIPVASIRLSVDCGPIYESPITFGASHLLEHMAFKSTTNHSRLQVAREVEASGGNVETSSSREQMEVNEQLQKVKAEMAVASENPQNLIMDAIHSVGYSGALAYPLLAPESTVNGLNRTILEEFFADATHFAIAFGLPGGEYPQAQSFSAFSNIYNHTGIFLNLATTNTDLVPKALDIATKELIVVARPGEVDQKQLDHAKQSTKALILMNLESRMVALKDTGRQVLTYGVRKPAEHLLKLAEVITLKDISSIAQKLLSSLLTMASYGNVYYLPPYDIVSGKFK